MTGWCDKLASTPTVGFTLDYHLTSADTLLEGFLPILRRAVEGDKQRFTMDRFQVFDLAFTTEDGFQYGVDSAKISVGFHHRIRTKFVSGGPPIMEMLSRPLPYSQLLPEVAKRLTEATLLLPGIKTRTVRRIGIVSQTKVAEADMPPGITRFIRYVGRPWRSAVEGYSIQITTKLDEEDGRNDRCIHILTKPEDPTELISVVFDWQRNFSEGRPATPESLRRLLTQAEKDSQKYFEDLAEGNRFDEEIIARAARD